MPALASGDSTTNSLLAATFLRASSDGAPPACAPPSPAPPACSPALKWLTATGCAGAGLAGDAGTVKALLVDAVADITAVRAANCC